VIVSKCPLRVSLAGGSTDLLEFVEKYGMGSVISFPIDLYTYIFLSYNTNNVYRINYSKTEEVDNIDDIKNDVAREVLRYFDLPPVTAVFTSDISTTGSGLASSSSYTIALVAAVNKLLNLNLSQFEICKTSLSIEHKFNPLTGYQDLYGCGIGGLKRLFFYSDRTVSKTLKSSVFTNINMYLVNTGTIRNSNKILSSVDFRKANKLLKFVDEMEDNIDDKEVVYKILNDAWHNKKKISPLILNDKIKLLDDKLFNDGRIKARKLCGAGGGGYFLILSEEQIDDDDFLKFEIDNSGVYVGEF